MGLIKDAVKKVKKALSPADGYSMKTKEDREAQVQEDFEYARMQREPQEKKWIELDNYYHNKHLTSYMAQKMVENGDVPYELPTLTDSFIQVESQIDTSVPSFQFRGRDGDFDSIKAKAREDAVKYILYNNKIERLNIENERYLNKLGNAFWKASWNPNTRGMGYVGDIEVGNPSPTHIFPDPAAYTIEDCEYIDMPYRIHVRKARRIWGDIIDEIGQGTGNRNDTEIFQDRSNDLFDETVQVLEHWYRDDEGDIACSILVEGTEVQFIPKFWEKTRHSGNQMYPIIKYCKIPKDQSFWDLSELEVIQSLIDAADMEFMTALLNDHFMANDIIIYEEGAIAEGYEIQHVPGEEIPLTKNNINNIRRLGGVSNNANLLNMLSFIKDRIEETCGNGTTQQGIEPSRVTTFRGIMALNEKADRRSAIKKSDRLKGFEELFKLCDWMALEFFDDNRMLILRGQKKEQQDMMMQYNSMQMLQQAPGMEQPYFPTVDCEVTAGDGIQKSKAFTVETITQLIQTQITIQNVGLVEQLIDMLELPNSEELKKSIEDGLQATMMPSPLAAPQMAQQMGGPQQAAPQGGQGNQFGGEDMAAYTNKVNQIMSTMTPEEYKLFQSKPQEQQVQILRTLMQGGGNNGQQQP